MIHAGAAAAATPTRFQHPTSSRTHFEMAWTSGAKLSILPRAALSLCCRISKKDRFSTRTASS